MDGDFQAEKSVVLNRTVLQPDAYRIRTCGECIIKDIAKHLLHRERVDLGLQIIVGRPLGSVHMAAGPIQGLIIPN